MRIEIAGENALIIYFSAETSPQVSAQIQQTTQRLEQALGDKLIDLIPSYASLLVIYDALACDHLWVRRVIQKIRPVPPEPRLQSETCERKEGAIQQNLMKAEGSTQTKMLVEGSPPLNQPFRSVNGALGEQGGFNSQKIVELPVWYSTESGPDLESLSQSANLSPEEIIAIHQSSEYRVYAIGFAPGFAYLGQVDERIAAPRLASPRLKVPRGAVAIADRQTAVYPDVSPGGWNLIGLCPTRMFDPQATPTMPVEVGDSIRFKAIDRDEFLALGGVIPEVIA